LAVSKHTRSRGAQQQLRVDPIACKAHGICAELFPEWIRLDDWGYPIIPAAAVPDHLMEHARRAVADCPRTALRLASLREEGAHQREP
jgi:ferredoxin